MHEPVPLLHYYLIHSARHKAGAVALVCGSHRVTYGELEAWSNAIANDLVNMGVERGDRVMPPHQGIAGLTLHLFTRREAVRLLTEAGFRVVDVRAISLRPDGRVPCAWWFGGLRAYGYLLTAEKAQALGIDAFCLKPFVLQELGQTIRRVLRQRLERGEGPQEVP